MKHQPAPTPAPTGRDDTSLSTRAAAARTYGLTVGLVVASIVGLAQIDLLRTPDTDIVLSWWAIAIMALVAEAMAFRFEYRREKHAFTFSEIPVIMGLFLASPLVIVVGRLVGSIVFLVGHERLGPRKLAVNVAVSLTELTIMLLAFEASGLSHSATDPSSWAATLMAVSLGVLAGHLAVALAVRWNAGTYHLTTVLRAVAVTTPVNTSFGLAATLLLLSNPWALVLLGGMAAFLLLSYQAYSQLAQRYQSLSLLYDFTKLVNGARNPGAVLEAMLSHAKDLLNAERAEIWLTALDGEQQRMVVDDQGWGTSPLTPDQVRLVGSWFGHEHEPRVVTKSSRSAADRVVAAALGAEDCIIAPITEADRVVGVVAVVDRIGDDASFGTQDGRMFATFASHASVALENGRLVTRLHDQARQREHEALHDALTGLPNRVLFGERLRECVGLMGTVNTAPAVAIMDLDGFKEINDTLGHQSGDHVLTEIARRIADVVDPAVLVARLGGDEFAFLMNTTDRADVEEQARRIVAEVGRPIEIDGLSINMGISVGVAMAPTDGDDAATLLQRADVAMYVAKGQADSVSFYVADHDANTPRRLTLAHDLRHAIDAGQFHLVYQPKARLDDGVVLGTEALARWVHPTLGPISPDEFIPLAERTGVMAQLTAWAIETALAQIPVWDSHGLDWGVSVNLSMRNLIDAELVPTVRRLLDASGADPGRLTLEITETNVMADADRTIDILNTFGDMGIHLSVDDFGTGYSSLSYLQRLPIDEVKIDKFFVLAMSSDANAEAIVRSILDLAKHLQLKVVAEGVEDQLTWDRLRDLGCNVAQGFFLARPMPAADLEHWARVQNESRSSAPLTLVRNAS